MFNRPKTVPYFTHSLVLCINRLLTHCAIVSLQIIFFKISQQIAKHMPRDCRFICKRRLGDQDWAAKLNWQTFYPVPRRFKTSRRFAVRSSNIQAEYSDNIYLNRCKFRFLELYFYHNESLEDWEESWRGQMRRKPHLPRRRSQKQRKQRRLSATDLTDPCTELSAMKFYTSKHDWL